ncbi:MAG: preprotein translocase subunit SecA [Patescibacteria group bacterium]|nr:preprotein translocase subunit SecA [Patescibacteria group bacterium]
MIKWLKNVFISSNFKKFENLVFKINDLEKDLEKLTDEQIKLESQNLKEKAKIETLDNLLPKAFALVREASKRTIGQRQFDVQLLGGIVLHYGAIAEMMTGEGKTLSAVAPAYLNALSGRGVHIVTVNDYLARRDTVWMGQIYNFLGLSVACIVPDGAFIYDPEWRIKKEGELLIDLERDTTGNFRIQHEFLRPISRREAYLADITYGTNQEFGFDYLRDNLAYSFQNQVQRRIEKNENDKLFNYAIIDEVDSILIDEARTPLIISAPDTESSEYYKLFTQIVRQLNKDVDYTVDEKHRSVAINDSGIEKVEQFLKIKNLYSPENLRLVHYLEESLKAKELFHKDKDYIVKNNEIIIIDEFTGRMLLGRRYSGGLHQAIEAKEGVYVQPESKTFAKISIQNYFRMYKKLSGMTGTAQTSAEEFYKVYGLEVYSIPPNKPCIRKDLPDIIYKNQISKWKAIVEEVEKVHKTGQPILIGTTSIEKNELLSAMLNQKGIKHNVLNAKNHEQEGEIIAQAGKLGAITVATNMAGRGVDIILGGNPPDKIEAEKIKNLGGLYVIGTERHEARRIDNQLRGRSGRQGDPGQSRFFLSLEDDLLRIFGGDKIKSLMEKFNLPDDLPLDLKYFSKIVEQAQSKVEGFNFDLRKHLLDYDDVLNKQRLAVYRKRQQILESLNQETLAQIIFDSSFNVIENILKDREEFIKNNYDNENKIESSKDFWTKIFKETRLLDEDESFNEDPNIDDLKGILSKKSFEVTFDPQTLFRILGILDNLWVNHLENLDALIESIGLRAYGQKDPLVEYRHEAYRLFNDFWKNFNHLVFYNIFKLADKNFISLKQNKNFTLTLNENQTNNQKFLINKKVGRNDLCPCGSGKKYKKCHGK